MTGRGKTYEQLRLDHQLCFRLYTASRLVTQAYEPYFRPLGITYTQYLVLLVLWEEDRLPVNDIGKRLYLGINTISPLIRRMERLGLVGRHEGKFRDHGVDTDKLLGIVPVLDDFIAGMSKAGKTPDIDSQG